MIKQVPYDCKNAKRVAATKLRMQHIDCKLTKEVCVCSFLSRDLTTMYFGTAHNCPGYKLNPKYEMYLESEDDTYDE